MCNFKLPFFCFLLLILSNTTAVKSQNPNIVIVFADDLGYGDVSCLNKGSKIQTPFIDKVAKNGITFTDAHTASAVCTPSRYGILTGRYAWRTRLKRSVLWGYSKPLIESNRLTIASMLKQKGYQTACIGKWHLGLDWALKDGETPIKGKKEETYGGYKIDFTKPVANGPTSLGFDYFFGHAASLDMPPYVFIENDRLTNISTVKRGRKQGFGRTGMADEDTKVEDYVIKIAKKTEEVITDFSKKKEPFFLYLPLPSPHTPLAVADGFKKSTKIGAYGDYVVETDWVVGEVVKALEKNGITENTLLIVTSDNGPETSMILRKKEYNHYSAGKLRGCKRDNWEGGHRVPFFAQWPSKIKPQSSSEQVLCLTDLMKTFATIISQKIPDTAAEDSYDMWAAFTGESKTASIREATIHHSSSGKFAIRKGDWVLLLHAGSGGNDKKYRPVVSELMKEPVSLYNLRTDLAQTNNVYKQHPEIVKELKKLVIKYVKDGRSTRGAVQKNYVYKRKWNEFNQLLNLNIDQY
ncbi:sulfatase family protein [Wenyingzhuangia sp. IMCC45574]